MTIANWLEAIALAVLCGMVIVFAIFALIDFTRGAEDLIGSLADEERDLEAKEEGGEDVG